MPDWPNAVSYSARCGGGGEGWLKGCSLSHLKLVCKSFQDMLLDAWLLIALGKTLQLDTFTPGGLIIALYVAVFIANVEECA